jgi:hypothetical protein
VTGNLVTAGYGIATGNPLLAAAATVDIRIRHQSRRSRS